MIAPSESVLARWRALREVLTGQLAMFESGALTLRANDINIAPDAMADLKRAILAFDVLISDRHTAVAAG